jgi:hypothetical protein
MQIKQRDAKFTAVDSQLLDLPTGNLIHYRERAVAGGHVVIHDGDSQVGPSYLAAPRPKPIKGLGGSDFMNKVAVDVQEGGGIRRFLVDDMT